MECNLCHTKDLDQRKIEYRQILLCGTLCVFCIKRIVVNYLRNSQDSERKSILEEFQKRGQ